MKVVSLPPEFTAARPPVAQVSRPEKEHIFTEDSSLGAKLSVFTLLTTKTYYSKLIRAQIVRRKTFT